MSWQPAEIIKEDWGYLQIVIDDKDVTVFRGIPTVVRSWSSSEPFSDSSAVISFPQISPFEQLGSGDLDWLGDWRPVEINVVRPGGETMLLWEGMIASLEDEQTETSSAIQAVCMGALFQVDLYVRAPLYLHDPVPVTQLLELQFSQNNRPHLRTYSQVIIEDDPEGTDDVQEYETKRSGSWNKSLTGFIQDELALMTTDEEMPRQWTLMKKPGRKPVLRMKDYSNIHAIATVGTPGITHQLSRDQTQSSNVIYGEGVDQAGTVWRHHHGTSSRYIPLAWDPNIHSEDPWYTLPEDYIGTDFPEFPDEGADSVRVEIHYGYGSGVSLKQAQRSARGQLVRDYDSGWIGTITFRSDPENVSRYEFMAGQNLLYRHFRPRDWISTIPYRTMTTDNGTAFKVNFDGAAFNEQNEFQGRVMHIAAVEVDTESMNVALTVDTKFRDLLSLAELIARNHEGHLDPAKRLRLGRTDIPNDEKEPWDYSSGSGFIPLESIGGDGLLNGSPSPAQEPDHYIHVPAKTWVTQQIRAAGKASIMRTEVRAFYKNGNLKKVPFHVSFYGHSKVPEDFHPEPFNEGVWDETLEDVYAGLPSGFIVGWGQYNQRAGFWPGLDSDGDPETGVLIDEGTWQFEMDERLIEPGVWVAIWCPEEAWFQGRLMQGVD